MRTRVDWQWVIDFDIIIVVIEHYSQEFTDIDEEETGVSLASTKRDQESISWWPALD